MFYTEFFKERVMKMKKLFKTALSLFLSAALFVPQLTGNVFASAPATTSSTTEPPVTTPEKTYAEPMFKINPKDVQTIRADSIGEFKIKIKNIGSIKVDRILAEITAPDEVILLDETGSQDIRFNVNSTEISVRYKALEKITSEKQVFNVSLKYYYTVNNSESIGSASAVINVPAKVTEGNVINEPVIKMTGQSLNDPIAAKSEYDYTLTFRNFGDVDVSDVYIALEGSGDIYFTGGTENGHIDTIKAGETANLKVKLHTADSIASLKQQITAAINYSYTFNNEKKNAESTGTVTVIAKVSEEADPTNSGSAPNIIVKEYDIGAEQIAAGESFNLNLDMFNTNSAVKVENLIMTVSAGESININGGTNTFFYPSMAAGGIISETIPLKALPTAATGITSINISFKYDYVKDGVSTPGNSEQSVFIPVYQPDKMNFEVSVPTYAVYPGNETYITTTYLNKGKSDISNVKAELVGDIQALSTSKVIGNVAPGANGTFDFVVTPFEGGMCEFTIKITYEDAMMEEITKEFPVSLTVEDMGMMEDPGMMDPGMMDPGFEDPSMMEENQGGFPWIVLWIGIGVLVVAVIVVIIVVKKKKKKKNILTEADINWEDDDLEKVLSSGSSEKEKTKV